MVRQRGGPSCPGIGRQLAMHKSNCHFTNRIVCAPCFQWASASYVLGLNTCKAGHSSEYSIALVIGTEANRASMRTYAPWGNRCIQLPTCRQPACRLEFMRATSPRQCGRVAVSKPVTKDKHDALSTSKALLVVRLISNPKIRGVALCAPL